MMCYADDITVVEENEREMKSMLQWMIKFAKKIVLFVDKTKIMMFNKTRKKGKKWEKKINRLQR